MILWIINPLQSSKLILLGNDVNLGQKNVHHGFTLEDSTINIYTQYLYKYEINKF